MCWLAARSRRWAELDAAFTAWLPIPLAQTHRIHGEVISVHAERDRIALTSLPSSPYLVTDRHLRRVGNDCLVSFEASLYSLPAQAIRAGQRVEMPVDADTVAIHGLAGVGDGTVLATHPHSRTRGA